MPIGGNGKDPDARFGRGAGCVAKGYKLHTVWSKRPLPEACKEVTPLNANEKAVAEALIGRLEYGGYLLGDGNYDASYVYDAAWAGGYQPSGRRRCRKAEGAGSGGHYQSPHRLRGLEILQGDFGKALFKARTAIERSFGNATAFGGGLGPLPAWVRGLGRVRTWVWAKRPGSKQAHFRWQQLRTLCGPVWFDRLAIVVAALIPGERRVAEQPPSQSREMRLLRSSAIPPLKLFPTRVRVLSCAEAAGGLKKKLQQRAWLKTG